MPQVHPQRMRPAYLELKSVYALTKYDQERLCLIAGDAYLLDKNSRLTTAQITDRLIYARERVPFVQANLIDSQADEPELVEVWRQDLQRHAVWANKPVPLFPYPGSPDDTKGWGAPDDRAWERAHAYYLDRYHEFSDIQDERPLALAELEARAK
jgi:anaerobic magnesium-protoporphyrin IX monomethyl ester cyclase